MLRAVFGEVFLHFYTAVRLMCFSISVLQYVCLSVCCSFARLLCLPTACWPTLFQVCLFFYTGRVPASDASGGLVRLFLPPHLAHDQVEIIENVHVQYEIFDFRLTVPILCTFVYV